MRLTSARGTASVPAPFEPTARHAFRGQAPTAGRLTSPGARFDGISVLPAPRATQAKLTITPAGDAHEVEADRVAQQVMRMPEPGVRTSPAPVGVQRACASCAQDEELSRVAAPDATPAPQEEEEPAAAASHPDRMSLQRAEGAAPSGPQAPASTVAEIASLRGEGGKPIDGADRAFFESRFGHDFGHVRVHTGGKAHASARGVQARAYTVGHDIVFANGEYAPRTTSGRSLLAHELTHVLQQRAGAVALMRSLCTCSSIPGARDPTSAEAATMPPDFPSLAPGDWCITAPATPTYNCFAWSVGNTSAWVDSTIDSVYGNRNGTLDVADFDAYYAAHGLRPHTAPSTPANAQVTLFAKSSGPPTHAAARSTKSCGGMPMFESKLGRDFRLIHPMLGLDGPLYGSIIRHYVP